MGKDDNTLLIIGGVLVGAVLIFKWDEVQAFLKEHLNFDFGSLKDPFGDQSSSGSCKPVSEADYLKYYSNRVGEELDKYKDDAIKDSQKLKLQTQALYHYKDKLIQMYSINGGCIIPLTGGALSVFAEILLDIAKKENIKLPKDRKAMLESVIIKDIKSNYARGYKSFNAITMQRITGGY